MKNLVTLVLVCLVGFSPLYAQVSVKKQLHFTEEQEVKIEALAKEYEVQGLDIKQARMKAEEEVAPDVVKLRISEFPWLYPNHTAWLASTPHPGSIHVDRDATIHGYTPEQLVKKILLKSYTAADEARIRNVRYTGWQGVAGGGNAWFDNNPNTIDYGEGNRGLAYFTKGTSEFDIEKGLLLSTGHTWGHEGPNKEAAAFGRGVGYDGITVWNYSSSMTDDVRTFDCDIRDFVIKAKASVGGLLEFDFCPAIGESSFDYVFGSEEYPEYVHSSYNDGFGFFVSGPYLDDATSMNEGRNRSRTYNSTTNVPGITLPSGRNVRGTTTYNGTNYATYYQFNIAQLPNGMPVGVDWTNWGYRGGNTTAIWNTLYGSNTITPWDSVGVGAWLVANNKENLHNTSGNIKFKAFNPQYHNIIVQDSALMELDGITIKLTAKMDGLIPGMWYHLKIIVCQTDQAHGDGVFIGNLDLGYAGGNIGGPSTGVSVADIDALGTDPKGDPMFLYGNRPCTYPMQLKFDATAASGNQIAEIEYITEPGFVFPASALQDLEGKQLFAADTIHLNGLKDTLQNYNFKISTDFDGFVNGQSVGLYVRVRGGGGDTVFYRQLYDTLSWAYQYRMITEVDPGSLTLKVDGGTPYVHRSIDGGESWKPVTQGFTQWELLTISEYCDILLYQPYQCCFDTIKIRRGAVTPEVQRYIDIPAVPGVITTPNPGKYFVTSRKDFTFTATYTGEPMSAQAVGYYTKTTLDLDKTSELQADGSYKYTIRYVVEPWTVSFIPKTNSGDVSNEAVSGQSVWSNGNTLYLNVGKTCIANIYTLTGLLYKQVELNGNTSLSLPQGFYIVFVDGRQYKVMMK